MSLHRPTSNNKKSVTFAPQVRCLSVKSHADMSQAERDAVWRTNEENKANHRETLESIHAIIRMRRNGLSLTADTCNDNEVICERGLEKVTCGSAVLRRFEQRRMNLINAVIQAQKRQWQMGYDHANTEILKAVSQVYSEEDTSNAWAMGQSDAAWVRRIQRHEKRLVNK
jgi:hypothetical protein